MWSSATKLSLKIFNPKNIGEPVFQPSRRDVEKGKGLKFARIARSSRLFMLTCHFVVLLTNRSMNAATTTTTTVSVARHYSPIVLRKWKTKIPIHSSSKK